MKLSQKQKILNMLEDGKWHCTSEMYASYMADPRTILAKLFDKGHGIVESQWCKTHHHDGKMKEWRLKVRSNFTNSGCCTSYGIFGEHSRDCRMLKVSSPQLSLGL